MASSDAACRALAKSQYGVITRRQAARSGLSAQQIRYRLRRGDWKPLGPQAFLIETQPTNLSHLMAACLVLDGQASHSSAAWLWGLIPIAPDKPEITVARPRFAKRPGVVIFTSTTPDPGAGLIDGIPTTTVERTLMDLAAIEVPSKLHSAMAAALEQRLTSIQALKSALTEHSVRGRAGIAEFRAALAVWALASQGTASRPQTNRRQLQNGEASRAGSAEPSELRPEPQRHCQGPPATHEATPPNRRRRKPQKR